MGFDWCAPQPHEPISSAIVLLHEGQHLVQVDMDDDLTRTQTLPSTGLADRGSLQAEMNLPMLVGGRVPRANILGRSGAIRHSLT